MPKEIVPKDSRYTPLTQQRFCCVPTCIQMIMLRHNLPLLSAELLGYHMGLTVPKEELKLFWNARTGPKPKAGYGTQIGKKQYDLNTVFDNLNIPLRMSLSSIDEFVDFVQFKDYLINLGKGDKDVLVCYDWGTLFGADAHNGHVCVLDNVFDGKNEVRIIDPEYKAPKWRVVKIKNLYDAMVFHGKDKSAGFWEFEISKK
ncbi:MAG TPA: hypothetical protein PLA19_04145 [Candidatus Pacearchaeota archaeon]|nr:hypothetical protein [Candidatus Pacearchaeota archaeon]